MVEIAAEVVEIADKFDAAQEVVEIATIVEDAPEELPENRRRKRRSSATID